MTALKTTSLRLRGTDAKVLEEEGLDSEGAVTSKSKLQSKVKALSGVDILTQSGEYKSTYEVLSQIAEVWEDISDIDQAALLELISGKRNSSVIAAILQNPEQLKAAYEDAQNAEGSALKENEKYMDSIQGRIDQFNNSLQTMWANLLDDDVVKFFVDLGKQLVVLLDKIGPLNALFIGFGVFAAKKYNLFDNLFGKPDSIEKSIEKLQQQRAKLDGLTGTKAANQRDAIDLEIKEKQAILDQKRAAASNAAAAAEAKDAAATKAGNAVDQESIATTTTKTATTWADVWAEMTREGATMASVGATIQQVLATKLLNTAYVKHLITTGQLTAAEVTHMSITKLLGLGFKGLAAGIGTATKSMLTFLFTTPVGWFILAAGAVVGLGVAFSKMHVSADEASEKLKETKEVISGLESELDGLKSELDEAKEKLAELLALPYLSITQQEEVDRLERTIELLEREIALRERELALKEQQMITDAEETMEKKFSNKDGGIGKSGDQAVDDAIKHYKENQEVLDEAYDLLNNWGDKDTKSIGSLSSNLTENLDLPGLFNFQTITQEDLIEAIKDKEADNVAIADSVNDFFSDADYQFTYGMSDELDEYRRQLDNLQLKWDKTLYGDASKVDAFDSMFGAGATEEMQNLKKEIDEIMAAEGNWANDDEKWQAKNDAIQTLIGSIDTTKDGYEQLDWTLKEFGATVQDIADYFTIANGAFDSDTISGLAKQYAKGIEVMKRFKAMSDPEARDNYVKENVFGKKPNANQPKTNKSDEETRKVEDKPLAKAEEKVQKEDKANAEKEAKTKKKAEKEKTKKEEDSRKEQVKAEEKARKEKEKAEAEAAEMAKKEAEEEAKRQAEVEEKARKEQERAKKQAEKEARAKGKAEKEKIEKVEKEKVKAEEKIFKEQEKQSKVQVDAAKATTSKVEADSKGSLSDAAKIGIGIAGASVLATNPLAIPTLAAGAAIKAAMDKADKKVVEGVESATEDAAEETVKATEETLKYMSKQWEISSGTYLGDVERPDFRGRMEDQADTYLNLIADEFGGTLEENATGCVTFARTLAQDMLYKATGDMDAFSTKYLQVDPEHDLGAKTLGSEMWAAWGEALGLEGGLPLVQSKRGAKINENYLKAGTLFTWANSTDTRTRVSDGKEKYGSNYMGHAGVITNTEYSEELGELLITYADDLHSAVKTVTQTEFENMGQITHAITQEMALLNKKSMSGIPFTDYKFRDSVKMPKWMKEEWGDPNSLPEDYVANLEDKKGDGLIDKLTGTEFGHDVEHALKTFFTTGQDDKRTQAFDFFKDKGLSDKAVSAIVGNFEHESNWDTDLFTNTGEIYGGIAQWRGDRLQALIDQFGEDATFEDQLDFAWQELQGDYSDVLSQMTDDKSLDELTKIFETDFEKPNTDLAMTSNRQRLAENIFDKFTKQEEDDSWWDEVIDFLGPMEVSAAELTPEQVAAMQEAADAQLKQTQEIVNDRIEENNANAKTTSSNTEGLTSEQEAAIKDSVDVQQAEAEQIIDTALEDWYDSSDDATKNIVYTLGLQTDTTEWDLDRWKQEVQNVVDGNSEYIDVAWDDLFKLDADGNFKAEVDKFGVILKGMDKDTRDTFISIAESVKNGKKSWEQGMAEFTLSGIDRQFAQMEEEIDQLNVELFPDAADEINGLIDTLSELKAAFASVSKTMDTLSTAQEEYNKHGKVSIETALDLLSASDSSEWDKILSVRADGIHLVAGAEDVLTAAQLKQTSAQLETSLAYSKSRLEAAKQIEAKKEEFKATQNLDGATQHLTTSQQNASIATANNTIALNNEEMQTDRTTASTLTYAHSSGVVHTAESVKAKAIGLVSSYLIYLDGLWQALADGPGGHTVDMARAEYEDARKAVLDDANSKTTSVAALEKEVAMKQKLLDIAQVGDTPEEYKKNSKDGMDDSGDGDGETAFEKMQARHEREIAALEHQQELIQGDIDILEAQRKGISSDYYKKLIAGENSKIDAYERQLKEAKELLAATSDTDEEYNDIVEHIWDIEKGLQDAALAAIEFGEAMNDNFLKSVTDLGDAYENLYTIIDRQKGSMELYKEGVEIGGGYVNERWYDDMIAKAGEAGDLARKELEDSLNAIDLWRNKANPFEEGTAEFEAWEYDRNTKLQEAWAQAADAKDKIQEMDNEALQLAEDKKDAYIEAWENVATGFERIGTLFENQISLIDGYESRLEALNINVSDAIYEKKIGTQKNVLDNLDEQIAYDEDMLAEYAAKYGTNDERYISKWEELNDKRVQRYEAETQIIELEQQIIDNQIDRFNQTIDRMNDAVDKMNNIKGLVSDEDVANEDGTWTAEGLTQAGMNFQEMAYQKEMVAEYADQMEELTELYEEGKISEKEYYEQMKELEDGQWSAIEAYKQMEDAIVDLAEARIDAIEDGLQEEIDAYAELIELKKEELDAERDLFEFRRDVEDQSKDIAEIERRMASISNSSSNEDRAEYKRLEKELYEANRGLDDTYRNHSYDQTSQALDEELETFEKTDEDYIQGLRDELENTDELIKRIYGDVVTNGQIVFETLVQLSDEHGFTLDENLVSPWRNANGESLTFEEEATEHYNSIKNTVEYGTPGFVENIEKPWKRGQEESKLFAQDAETYLQSALDSAKNKQQAMTDATAAPWLNMKSLIDQGPSWVSTAAADILKVVKQNVIDINAEYAKITNVGAQLSGNVVSSSNSTSTTPTTTKTTTIPTTTTTTTKKPQGEVARETKKTTTVAKKPTFKEVGNVWSGEGHTGVNIGSKKMTRQEYFASAITGADGNVYFPYTAKGYKNRYVKKGEGFSYSVSGDTVKMDFHSLKPIYAKYAKGTLGTTKDQFAITDEPQYGDELVLIPNAAGNLSFMRKGTGVVPAELTKRIMEIAQMPASELGNNIVKAVVPNIETTNQSIQVNFEALVKADNITNDVLPEVEKLVAKQLNTFTKNLNYSLKKVGGR